MWPFSSSSSSTSSSSNQQQSQDATSLEGTYKPMKREERTQCWAARDAYFACLDKNNILDAIKDSETAEAKCGKESQAFERDCATSWVVYFKQKRVADYQKQQQIKKLEAEGAVPVGTSGEKPSWKIW